MRTWQDKERAALAMVGEQMRTAANPVVLCSFGKDSTVLLHLCLRFRKVPVLFLRFAKFHEKHVHALRVMQEWDLEVYDLWPSSAIDYQNGEFFEVLHSYHTGLAGRLYLFSGIRKRRDDEGRYLCAIDDLIARPKALNYGYPWDVTFHGHKGTDDPEIGAAGPIVHPVSQLGGTRLVVPFVDWTDDDIWSYIRRYDLPYDRQRYDQRDESVSPDKYPTCYRCLDSQFIGQVVQCPKYDDSRESVARSPEDHERLRTVLIQEATYCEVTGAPRDTENTAHL